MVIIPQWSGTRESEYHTYFLIVFPVSVIIPTESASIVGHYWWNNKEYGGEAVMKKLQKEFEQLDTYIKIDSETGELISKREKLKSDIEDCFPENCEKLGIDITKSNLRFIHQGSYKIGTTIKTNGSVDLDYAVIMPLDVDAYDDPRPIKKAIKDSLFIKSIRLPEIKEPCVTVAYHSNGKEYMHIDFPVYAEWNGHLFLARGKEYSNNYSWELADPEGLNDYFLSEFRGRAQLKRIVRYIKRWKQYKYESSSDSHEVPPSVGLTILACQNYQEFTQDGDDDLLSLYYTMKAIADKFIVFKDNNGTITSASIDCFLPVLPHSDIFYKMRGSASYMITFYKKLSQAVADLREAINLSDEYEAAKCVRRVLSNDFVLPEKKASSYGTTNKREYNFGN